MNETIKDLATRIRKEMTTLCNQVIEYSKTDDFPNADKDLDIALDMLNNGIYNVVVCGEVKKGKSSFINAIIGKDILPVDTRVATSQAFRIINSDTESYYLVYTDGTKEPVGREDLDRYGSQARIDKDGEPITFDKIVDYMEIHTPIPFLPKSIVLVDTPGLGALYANHAVVTERHLAKASAVVFILDPSNPITEPEIAYLEKITDITSNVMIVMTKQDNYDGNYIKTQIRRNTEILTEKGIAEKLSNTQINILPMSSALLKDVSDTDSYDKEERELFYDISSFENVKKELLNMLEATIALSKNVFAYNAVNAYNNKVMAEVAERDKILRSPNEANALSVQKQQIKADFQSKWGPNGKEQKSIINDVNAIVNAFSTQAMALFNPGTDIYNKLMQEIDSLNDYDETKTYAELFPKKIMTEYMQAWQGLNEECFSKIVKLISNAREQMTIDRNGDTANLMDTLPPFSIPKRKFLDVFNDTKAGWLTLFFAANVVGLSLTIFALPIAAVIGWFTGNAARTNRMKMELKSYLNSNLSSLRNQVLSNPINKDDKLSKSLFEDSKEKHLKQAQNLLSNIYNEQLDITQKEVNRINEQITLLNTQRAALITRQEAIKEKWDPAYTKLKELRNTLSKLENLIRTNKA